MSGNNPFSLFSPTVLLPASGAVLDTSQMRLLVLTSRSLQQAVVISVLPTSQEPVAQSGPLPYLGSHRQTVEARSQPSWSGSKLLSLTFAMWVLGLALLCPIPSLDLRPLRPLLPEAGGQQTRWDPERPLFPIFPSDQ